MMCYLKCSLKHGDNPGVSADLFKDPRLHFMTLHVRTKCSRSRWVEAEEELVLGRQDQSRVKAPIELHV